MKDFNMYHYINTNGWPHNKSFQSLVFVLTQLHFGNGTFCLPKFDCLVTHQNCSYYITLTHYCVITFLYGCTGSCKLYGLSSHKFVKISQVFGSHDWLSFICKYFCEFTSFLFSCHWEHFCLLIFSSSDFF